MGSIILIEKYGKNFYYNFRDVLVWFIFSNIATFEEFQGNEYNLKIPRYVDTFEEEAEVDIAAVQKEIETLGVNWKRCRIKWIDI